MHDWTLIGVYFDWRSGQVKVDFLNQDSTLVSLIANDVSNLRVPRMNDWGASVSVNGVAKITHLKDGRSRIKIEMQSGDLIEIDAKAFVLPGS